MADKIVTNAPTSEILDLSALAEYSPGSVVSRTLIKGGSGTITVFAFDEGEGLSEHSAPFDAFVTVLDGEGRLTINGKPLDVKAGQTVIMPKNIPHSVHAHKPFKMLLVMIRG